MLKKRPTYTLPWARLQAPMGFLQLGFDQQSAEMLKLTKYIQRDFSPVTGEQEHPPHPIFLHSWKSFITDKTKPPKSESSVRRR